MKEIKLRVSLAGVCLNAADSITDLVGIINDPSSWTDKDLSKVDGAETNRFMLLEIARLARETSQGLHTLDEFAEFFCLKGE